MSEQRVLVRVDAGMGIGHGHLVRVLAVAKTLVERGYQVTVATRARGEHARHLVSAAGAQLLALPGLEPGETADGPAWPTARQEDDANRVLAADSGPWGAVVVDHYRLDARWERLFRPHTQRLVVIDDLANRPHDTDVLVDHNWYGTATATRYRGLVPESTTLLLGPRYALIQADYRAARMDRAPVRHPPQRIVVSFGGTDVCGQTIRALRGLDVVPEAEVAVVMGSERAVTDELRLAVEARPRTSLDVELPTLAPLLRVADLAIGAGGISTWERLCLRVPSLVTTVSANQSGVSRALHDARMTRWLGVAGEVTVDDYRAALRLHVGSAPLDIAPIVDGHGAPRVGYAILPTEDRVRVRPATVADDASFVTAAESGIVDGQGPVAWRRRALWFARAVQRGDSVQVLECGGTPVGVIGGPEGEREQADRFVPVTKVRERWET